MRIAKIHLIKQKVEEAERHGEHNFDIKDAGWTELHTLWQQSSCLWKKCHDVLLLKSILKYCLPVFTKEFFSFIYLFICCRKGMAMADGRRYS